MSEIPNGIRAPKELSGLVFSRPSISSSHLVGYLLKADGFAYPGVYYNTALVDPTWKFEDVLARLITIGKEHGQDIFKQCDDQKSIFKLEGTYKGEVFTLYDYKGNAGVNIGGTNQLDVAGLVPALVDVIRKTKPTAFTAQSPYTGETFTYP